MGIKEGQYGDNLGGNAPKCTTPETRGKLPERTILLVRRTAVWVDRLGVMFFTSKNPNSTSPSVSAHVSVLSCFVQPLLDLERNGPNLHYGVWWRRKDLGEEWSNVTTAESKHVVHNTETYISYEIKVQARNEFGRGPESNVVVGYSGEDSESTHIIFVWENTKANLPKSVVTDNSSDCSRTLSLFVRSEPVYAPTDLRVSKFDSTKAVLHWKPVDLSSVQGEFKEYRVRRPVFV